MATTINILALVGIIISTYAFSVHIALKNKEYKPGCDLNSKVSCSKAFKSQYANILGVPNPVWGAIYYVVIILLSFLQPSLLGYIAGLGLIASISLAYLSYFKLKTFCLVCTATYLVNIAIFILALAQHL